MTDKAIEAALRAYMRAAIAAYERALWQTMESAPRDGTKIDLLYPEPRGRTIDCFWYEGGWCWRTPVWENGKLLPNTEWFLNCYPNMEPTHWRPLPPPPEE